jgi:DNA-directed RNA polymerase specialized sigma24 family protein
VATRPSFVPRAARLHAVRPVASPEAPRPIGAVALHARALRAALSDGVRTLTRNQLARAIRELVASVLAWHEVPAHARDDIAHTVTLDTIGRIESGHVREGCEDAYVRQCARHRAADYFRSIRSGVFTVLTVDELDELATFDDAESLLVAREDDQALEALARRARSLLDSAPPSYRRVLQAVYLDGVPIERVVESDLDERVRAGEMSREEAATPKAKKRARDLVDKHLERARKWLRSRLFETMETKR